MNEREFYLNIKGWSFSGIQGLKLRIEAIEGQDLTETQKKELQAMKEALEKEIERRR